MTTTTTMTTRTASKTESKNSGRAPMAFVSVLVRSPCCFHYMTELHDADMSKSIESCGLFFFLLYFFWMLLPPLGCVCFSSNFFFRFGCCCCSLFYVISIQRNRIWMYIDHIPLIYLNEKYTNRVAAETEVGERHTHTHTKKMWKNTQRRAKKNCMRM